MHQEADRFHTFTRRALVLGGAQLGLFGVLLARLYRLQIEESSSYRLLAESNRVNQRLLVPPRGRILDRGGRPIATNVPTYRVRLVPEQTAGVRSTLARLAELIAIPPARIEDVSAEARTVRSFLPLTVREDLTWDEVARIAVQAPDLPGVLLDQGLLRDYPDGLTLAHVLGYLGPVTKEELAADNDPLLELPDFRIGKSGVERFYDKPLRGRAGLSRVEVNAVGREIRELDREDGEPGQDLRLTLDLELQRFCMDRLASGQAAAAVVVDVRTGGILALASVPSFDPGLFSGPLTPDAWAALRDDPMKPLVDKCIRGEYPPGSTFKMMTGLAALEAGISPAFETVCPGYMKLGNATFHCWRASGHGRIGFIQGYAQSCDVFFYDLARRIGIDAIADMARRFGLGRRLDMDLPGERPGLIPSRAWKRRRFGQPWQKGETLICGIGQGYVVATPLQLAIMTARLCNGARAVRPHLLRAVDEGASSVPPIEVDKASLDIVLRGMYEVVNGPRGTARAVALQINGVQMAGKTGSAQVRRIGKSQRDATGRVRRAEVPWAERDHALFVCFAPFDQPRYALSVVVEHGEHGASAAGPLARDIMTKALELDPAARPPGAATLAEAG
jgi:penicillin-binding protein 2